ncbi:MAG: hypothetical protein AAFV71_13715 [Cyanobacteria bacterium J06633_8]
MKTQVNPRNIQEILFPLLGRAIDNLFTDFIPKNTQGTLKEIIVGLNTRSQHLNNRKEPWFELDLPDIIRLERRFSRKSKHHKFISIAGVKNDWLNSLTSTSTRLRMVVTEGLQMYFKKQQVKQLFDKLIENFLKSEYAFDSKSSMIAEDSIASNRIYVSKF